MRDLIMKYQESQITDLNVERPPILLILDAYAVHKIFIESKYYEQFNIYTVKVPENMTPILQPLDVSFNRPFHDDYSTHYINYMQRAMDADVSNSEYYVQNTGTGNIKVPSRLKVSGWVASFCETVSPDLIRRSFECCGICVEVENYQTP